MRNNAGQQSSPVLVMCSGVGSAGGHVVFTAWLWGQLILKCICAVRLCLAILLPALPPSLVSMRWVSWFHCFCSVMVPGGCRSQGCHDCPTTWLLCTGLSWLPYVLGYCAPLSFQAPSPSSSIVDELIQDTYGLVWNYCMYCSTCHCPRSILYTPFFSVSSLEAYSFTCGKKKLLKTQHLQ